MIGTIVRVVQAAGFLGMAAVLIVACSGGNSGPAATPVSRDEGATWSWTLLSKSRFDDRPWVEVAADGTAHAIWNDGSGVSRVRQYLSEHGTPPTVRKKAG